MLLSPPPFVIDLRIATSAVEGLRFLLATRIADISDLVGRLETMEVHALARRVRVRTKLRTNEADRQRLLSGPPGAALPEVEGVFNEGIRLCGALGALDERVASIEARLKGLSDEVDTLRELCKRLLDTTELRGANLDAETARYHRATRSLSQLVDQDNAVLLEQVLEGPVQQLADMAVRLEVVRRLMIRRLPGAAKEISACPGEVRRVVDAFDRLVFSLHPDTLDADGLAVTLRELARRVPPPVTCRFELIGEERQRLRPSLETTVLRVVQEAVGNAIRHGRAEQVDIVLSLHGDRVVVVVRDEGEGFDVVATEARLGRTGALGLLTMRERVELEGGALKLRSAAGAGTEIRATFDLLPRDRPLPPAGPPMVPRAAPPPPPPPLAPPW